MASRRSPSHPTSALTPLPPSPVEDRRGGTVRLPFPRSEGPGTRARVPSGPGAGDEGLSACYPATLVVTRNVHIATLERQDLAFLRDEAVPPDAAVVDPEQVK